jgi:hypothetical protein
MTITYSLKAERKRPIEGQEGNIKIVLKKQAVRLWTKLLDRVQ